MGDYYTFQNTELIKQGDDDDERERDFFVYISIYSVYYIFFI